MTLEQALETYIRSTHGEIGLQKFWAERNAQMAVVMGSRKGNDLLHCSLAQGRERMGHSKGLSQMTSLGLLDGLAMRHKIESPICILDTWLDL